MGMEVQMVPGKGPHFPDPLQTPEDFARLNQNVDVTKSLHYVFDAITLTRKRLEGRVPLLGFTGAPWTLMGYMIEGGGSKNYANAKKWLTHYPDASLQLLKSISKVCVDYLVGQIKAGAQMVQVFESTAGALPPHQFRKFAWPVLRDIAIQVKHRCKTEQIPCVPMIVFAKDAHHALADLIASDYDVIGIDWTMDIKQVQRVALQQLQSGVRSRITFQGNLDPILLYAPPDVLRRETEAMLENFLLDEEGRPVDKRLGYICNLGHGILPDVSVENARIFLETVNEVTRRIFAEQ